MPYDQIDPDEAHRRQQSGWKFIDVRSPVEFSGGHPAGAVNIPILFKTPQGMQPNPDFLAAVQAHFPADTQLLMGCRSGGRSDRACQVLQADGYSALANVAGGFSGTPTVPGWQQRELPTGTDIAGVSWEDLKPR